MIEQAISSQVMGENAIMDLQMAALRIKKELNVIENDFSDFTGLDEFLNCVNQDLNDFTPQELVELVDDLQNQQEACQNIAESVENISNELSSKLDVISDMIKAGHARKNLEREVDEMRNQIQEAYTSLSSLQDEVPG